MYNSCYFEIKEGAKGKHAQVYIWNTKTKQNIISTYAYNVISSLTQARLKAYTLTRRR